MHTFGFEKLTVWQESRKLVKEIYLLSREYPDDEKYGLVSQIRRAVFSVSSNIAEGSSRVTYKDQANFYNKSFSSLMELLSQIILSHDLKFINESKYLELRSTIEQISNQLNALRNAALRKIK